MRSKKNIEKLIKDAPIHSNPDVNQAVLQDLLKQIDNAETQKPGVTPPNVWRTIMRNPITKLAVAAVIVIAVLIAMNPFGGSAASVAWGEVVRNVEASPGFIYRQRQIHNHKETETKEFYTMAYGSAKYGFRMDLHSDKEVTIQTYANLRDKAMISIMHQSKHYRRVPLSNEELAELEELDAKEAIRKFLSAGYRKLGRKNIDGVETEGVEITDPAAGGANFQVDSYVARLWVAVDTGLPILIESDTVGNNGTLEIHTVQDNFQWNVELDASEFEPNIPADYTLLEE